jgi:alkanesulfonate monooxygenase SsuD/methylene tetrahydromethanopterin reductase-like flavin-dependent oxidoreductase (luciferase family)
VASSEFNTAEAGVTAAAAKELEELGYSTLWLHGGRGNNLTQIGNVVRSTSRIGVASGILSVDEVPASEVTAAHAALAPTHPGRFVVGLGGAHGAKPLATLNAYLDEIQPVVPASERILSALAPADARTGPGPCLIRIW